MEAVEPTETSANSTEEHRRQSLYNALYWAWTVNFQIRRLNEIQDQLEADVWRALATTRQADYTQEKQEQFFRLRAEAHFLVNAADKLIKALPAVGHKAPSDFRDDVNLLRDCFEHPHKQSRGLRQKKSAYEKYKETHPDKDPTDHRFGAQGTYVGGLDISKLGTMAGEIYRELLDLQSSNFVWKGWEFR